MLADLHAPGDRAAGAVLELAGDLDALLAGVLAERLDATACGRGALSLGWLRGDLGVGERADDGDLVAVELEGDRVR